jgi:RNA polymerase sigma-70 factor, ECF subfamily
MTAAILRCVPLTCYDPATHFLSISCIKSRDEMATPIRFKDRTMDDPRKTIARQLGPLLPRLRRLARALTGSTADADDLVQTVVEKALRKADQWSAEASSGSGIDAWIFRIMKNAWIDEVRSRKVQTRIFVPDEGQDAVGTDGLAAFEARLTLGVIQQAMDTLADDQRTAVALVMVDGLSYKEAAAVLDVPVGTLTSRLARGRQQLENLLRPTLGQSLEFAQ